MKSNFAFLIINDYLSNLMIVRKSVDDNFQDGDATFRCRGVQWVLSSGRKSSGLGSKQAFVGTLEAHQHREGIDSTRMTYWTSFVCGELL